MFGNRGKINKLKEIEKLEQIASDKKLPPYKRHQAMQKLYNLKNKYEPKVFHTGGTYIKPKEKTEK